MCEDIRTYVRVLLLEFASKNTQPKSSKLHSSIILRCQISYFSSFSKFTPYTVLVKKNATICKICAPLFDKNRAALL